MKRALLILLLLSGICFARFDSNLVAWWKLNDNAATTTVVDSAGSNTGTASANTEDMTTAGKVNQALIFDGLDDEVDCASDSSIDNIFDGGGSVSIWLLVSGTGEGATGAAMDKGEWNIGIATDTTTLQFFRDFNGIGQHTLFNFTIAADVWQHIVVVYDDDLAANDPTVYVNGVDANPSQQGGNPDSDDQLSDAAISLFIGDDTGSAGSWDGKIDNVMMFNKELTAKEVKYLYHGGKGREVIGQRNPRGRYSGNRRIRQNIH